MKKGITIVLVSLMSIAVSVVLLRFAMSEDYQSTPVRGQNNKNSEYTQFVANRNATRYHFPWCKTAMKIKDKDIVIFKSVDEAINAGFVPCPKCKPPTKTKLGVGLYDSQK